jgi:hypothetical protein
MTQYTYRPHRTDHGYYQGWRSIQRRKIAAHNRTLVLFALALVVAVAVMLAWLFPGVDWARVLGGVANNVAEAWR